MRNLASGTAVLLLGPDAEAMAPRLEVSGYRPLTEVDLMAIDGCGREEEPPPLPAAVILSPGCERRIAELRSRWSSAPLLLGIPADTVPGRSHCLSAGADDFWLTEMAASDLLTRLRLHLQLRPPPHRPREILREGDLELEPDLHRVRRGGRRIALSAREYQLLLLLLRRRGEVVRREVILGEIWPGQSAGGSNVIEVYVRYLRRKLEAGGESRLIHTIRGLGYCLDQQPPAPGRFRS